MKTSATKLVAAVIAADDIAFWTKRADLRTLFRGPKKPDQPSERDLYDYVSKHLVKYGQLPDPERVENETGQSVAQPPKEPPLFWYDRLHARHIDDVLRRASEEASKYVTQGTEEYEPAKALEIIRVAVARLHTETGEHAIADFRESGVQQIAAYESVSLGNAAAIGLPTGFPYVDAKSPGLVGGELYSVGGWTNMGKTFVMLQMALHLWRTGRALVFVTLEMARDVIEKRLLAMYAGIMLEPLIASKRLAGEQGQAYTDRLNDAALELAKEPVPFWVVDAKMAATVSEIQAIAQHKKAAAVYVDGGYLLRHEDARLDRYRRVAENCDLLKMMAIDLDAPVVASWQLKDDSEGYKKKQGDPEKRPKLKDLADAPLVIARNSSMVLLMGRAGHLTGIKKRKLYVAKGRSGEVGDFEIRWDFIKSDFSQWEEESTAEGDVEYLG